MADENEEPEVSEEPLEGASRRRGYAYVRIPESMANQILRNGFMPSKKAVDGITTTGTRASKRHQRE